MKKAYQKIFSAIGAATLVSVFTPSALAQSAEPENIASVSKGFDTVSPEAKIVWANLQSRGQHNFIILDKKNAILLVVENGHEILRTSALTGKSIGDDRRENPSVTPAGQFDMEVVPSDTQGGSLIHFLCSHVSGSLKACYSIHSTVGSARVKRYGDPALAAVSNGCVNLPFEKYVPLAQYVERHSTDIKRPVFIVLPQTMNLEETRVFFNIPAEPKLNP